MLRQVVALTLSGLRTLPQRLGASLVTVVGIVIVVAVLASMLAVGEGADAWTLKNARPDRVVVLGQGALSAVHSSLSRDAVAKILSAPALKRGADGKPLASAGAITFVEVMRSNHQRSNLPLIGMSTMQVYPEIRLTSGRWFQPGLHELVVSTRAQKIYRSLALGDRVALRGSRWTVVGTFEAPGTVFDQTFFSDAETVLAASGNSSFQEVIAVLESPSAFGAFQRALPNEPTQRIDVFTEAASRRNSLGQLPWILDFVSYFIGGLLAAGAICAALSSLYAAVDTRRREIATLRAIGFAGAPVIAAVLIEGLLLALLAALVGESIAWLFFNGNIVNTQNVTFPMAVSPRVMILSVSWALAIGFVGALLPAVRAARLPVTVALRESV